MGSGAHGLRLRVAGRRESLWNFPVAISSCALYIVVYYRAQLYADSLLQVMFIALSFYGWYKWLYGGRSKAALPVSRTRRGSGRDVLRSWWCLLRVSATISSTTPMPRCPTGTVSRRP
jgi:nicotinamide riboside transporter PnuC